MTMIPSVSGSLGIPYAPPSSPLPATAELTEQTQERIRTLEEVMLPLLRKRGERLSTEQRAVVAELGKLKQERDLLRQEEDLQKRAPALRKIEVRRERSWASLKDIDAKRALLDREKEVVLQELEQLRGLLGIPHSLVERVKRVTGFVTELCQERDAARQALDDMRLELEQLRAAPPVHATAPSVRYVRQINIPFTETGRHYRLVMEITRDGHRVSNDYPEEEIIRLAKGNLHALQAFLGEDVSLEDFEFSAQRLSTGEYDTVARITRVGQAALPIATKDRHWSVEDRESFSPVPERFTLHDGLVRLIRCFSDPDAVSAASQAPTQLSVRHTAESSPVLAHVLIPPISSRTTSAQESAAPMSVGADGMRSAIRSSSGVVPFRGPYPFLTPARELILKAAFEAWQRGRHAPTSAWGKISFEQLFFPEKRSSLSAKDEREIRRAFSQESDRERESLLAYLRAQGLACYQEHYEANKDEIDGESQSPEEYYGDVLEAEVLQRLSESWKSDSPAESPVALRGLSLSSAVARAI